MSKKGQVLIIFIWILAILVVYVLGMTSRAQGIFKYARYRKDGQKSLYLARAALNVAVLELKADKNSYDSLSESWVDNEEIFSKVLPAIEPEPEGGQLPAEVSYVDPENGERVFGVRDEERKIDINTASEQLLTIVAEKANIMNAGNVARNIFAWRQEGFPDTGAYKDSGYSPKGAGFALPQELLFVPGVSEENYSRLEKLITVYTQGKININTVTREVLGMVNDGIAMQMGISNDFSRSLTEAIINSRQAHDGYFTGFGDMPEPAGEEETNIFNRLKENIVFASRIFLIETIGRSGGMDKKITAVYDKGSEKGKFLYWHET